VRKVDNLVPSTFLALWLRIAPAGGPGQAPSTERHSLLLPLHISHHARRQRPLVSLQSQTWWRTGLAESSSTTLSFPSSTEPKSYSRLNPPKCIVTLFFEVLHPLLRVGVMLMRPAEDGEDIGGASSFRRKRVNNIAKLDCAEQGRADGARATTLVSADERSDWRAGAGSERGTEGGGVGGRAGAVESRGRRFAFGGVVDDSGGRVGGRG
jgi:hypothetical protein